MSFLYDLIIQPLVVVPAADFPASGDAGSDVCRLVFRRLHPLRPPLP